MGEQISLGGPLATSVFNGVRLALGIFILAALGLVVYRALVSFVGEGGRDLRKGRYRWAAANLAAVLVLFLFQRPAARLLTSLGMYVTRTIHISEESWASSGLVGLYNTLAATAVLLLLIQIVGRSYWLFETLLEGWQKKYAVSAAEGQHEAVAQIVKALRLANKVVRSTVIVTLLLVFLPLTLRFSPRAAVLIDSVGEQLAPSAIDIGLAILNYLPNLAYLLIILLLGWAFLKLTKYIAVALETGSLVIGGFEPEWALPTYKLFRFLFLVFLLMVSYPYLPGASSRFFQGFSVFIGALVTFGSSGAIGNIISGIVLTYTRAFHIGDMVRIGDTTGTVLEKTLLVTRLRTNRNEEMTIPNGAVLSNAVQNYSARASAGGLALTVTAGIGYEVDWRRIHELMTEAARRTEHILAEPAPLVLQTSLGDFAVEYELRAWTARANEMHVTSSNLRRNVLDAFNTAGIEIMTPSVFAHRDASVLAVPEERFPRRGPARGIAVDVNR